MKQVTSASVPRPKALAVSRPSRAAAAADLRLVKARERRAPKVEVKTLVKPVSNALGILRYLATEGRPATNGQVARHLKINPSTCYNILRTLAYEGVLEFDDASKSYRPGPELGKLVGNTLQERQRLSAIRPLFHRFAERFGVTMALWRQVGDDRIVLALVEYSSNALSISIREGLRLPLLLGSTGRLVATRLGLSKREVHKQFKTVRWSKAPDFESYWAEAEAAIERGWSTDAGNYAAGIQTAAAAVLDHSNRMTFSVVALMFLDQFDDLQIKRLGEGLMELRDDVAHILY